LSNNVNESQDKLVVKIVPWGPTVKSINSLTSKLLNRPRVKNYLRSISDEGLQKKNKRPPRLLSFELLPETTTTTTKRIALPKSYFAKYYDYENNCCITVKGKLGQLNPREIVESKQQPLPNNEEFEEAVGILSQKEPIISEAIQNKILKPYRLMPPLFIKETSEI
jgi:hypothetical protein